MDFTSRIKRKESQPVSQKGKALLRLGSWAEGQGCLRWRTSASFQNLNSSTPVSNLLLSNPWVQVRRFILREHVSLIHHLNNLTVLKGPALQEVDGVCITYFMCHQANCEINKNRQPLLNTARKIPWSSTFWLTRQEERIC